MSSTTRQASITDAMHYNRDENGFTARLFHGVLVPLWTSSTDNFRQFLEMLSDASTENAKKAEVRFPRGIATGWNEGRALCTATFVSCNLFVELWDVHNYCESRGIKLPDVPKRDRTELDAVIVLRDSSGVEHLIVFEVKCYSDLDSKELERQQMWLRTYKGKLYSHYHHFVLIAHDNLSKGRKIFKEGPPRDFSPFHIITWDDLFVREHLPESLFNRESLRLSRTISRYSTKTSLRSLIAPGRSIGASAGAEGK